MSKRVYKKQNVYDASIERIDFIFDNFERIYISFSGGKDSMLACFMAKKYGPGN